MKIKLRTEHLIFLLSLSINIIITILSSNSLMWDENVYLANAKHVLGITPYFEHFRFPLLWWNIALLIPLIKENYLLVRIYLSIIFSVSTVFFYRILLKTLKEDWKAIIFTLLIILNGLMIIYSNRIYPDVYGMSFLIISIYSFHNYLESKRERDFIFFILFSILSFLAKYPYGLFLLSSWIFVDRKEKMRSIAYSILFLTPFFLYNLLLYKNPIKILLDQFYLAYLWQTKEPISLFFENALRYLGILIFSVFFIPIKDGKFERSIYLFTLLSFIYFAFLTPQKDPRYLIQILPTSIIIFGINTEKLKGFELLIYILLSFSMIYSTINGIFDTTNINLCYGELSSAYQSVQFLKKENATKVLSNAFWVWYGNLLNIESYSIYNNSLDYFVEKYDPDFIVYSKNYGISVELNLSRYRKVFEYMDFCGIDVKIYRVR
ncbi:MAG: hypothetical protein BXU00_00835 [Candidatus Nanoclepta minutus]|uniref:Uncharacterized protein n=1 Tax=Candidatus Nanoclepta minutus TaxID=1940235 RepID=A0A397WNY5_9ARCH|nr:MAG: hypothetical protein BXU00_00835 [Candidatus Nanoclepta minutus]